jgi:hypothetical protein
MTLTEIGIVFAYFLLAVGLVLTVGYVLGRGRLFGSHRIAVRVDQAANLACRGSLVLVIGGASIAFTGYALGHPMATRIGALVLGAGLPLLLVAEHWGSGNRRRA